MSVEGIPTTQVEAEASGGQASGNLRHIAEGVGHVLGGALQLVGEVIVPQLHHANPSEHANKQKLPDSTAPHSDLWYRG